jgi:Signal transduction histidine kinase regulating citrate/malate metabolism
MLLAIFNFYECLLITTFVRSYFHMNERFREGYLFLLFFLLGLEISFLNCGIIYKGYYSLIGILTIFTFVFCFSFNHKIEQLLICTWIFCSISAIDNLVVISASVFLPHSFVDLPQQIEHHFGLLLASKIIITLIALVVRKWRKKMMVRLSSVHWSLLLLLASMSFIVLSVVDHALFVREFREREVLIAIISLIVLNLLSQALFIYFVEDSNERTREHLQLQALKSQQNSAEFVKDLNEQVKKLKHDLKHVLGMVSALIKNQQYDEAQTLLVEYTATVNQVALVIQSGNILLDFLLNEKLFQAKTENIQFEPQIQKINYSFISDMDLCIVLGNLLDNAFENCTAKERKVCLEMSIMNQYLRIIVRNKTAGFVLVNNPELKSTKNNKTFHGYGIKSIRSIVKKYDGYLEFTETGDEFSCIILLDLRPDKTKNRPVTTKL